jgi:hypothetical protein
LSLRRSSVGAGRKKEDFVLTIVFLVIAISLLTVAALFGLMEKDKRREGQSGSPQTAAEGAKQGRAPGLD